jgi:hypothetical protein
MVVGNRPGADAQDTGRFAVIHPVDFSTTAIGTGASSIPVFRSTVQ